VILAGDASQGLTPSQALASHVFARHPDAAVREVWVGGQCRVRDGHHAHEAQARRAFLAARKQLLEAT
jgi:formimidoylglutamate deiminase